MSGYARIGELAMQGAIVHALGKSGAGPEAERGLTEDEIAYVVDNFTREDFRDALQVAARLAEDHA